MLMLVLLYNLFNCLLLWQPLFRVCCPPFPASAASFPSIPSQGQQNYLINKINKNRFCAQFLALSINNIVMVINVNISSITQFIGFCSHGNTSHCTFLQVPRVLLLTHCS